LSASMSTAILVVFSVAMPLLRGQTK